jgi:hypothetical protein
MSWTASFGAALVTGLVALFGAGTVASLAADWHNVSTFEGAAGFFVVGMSLLGGIGGFVIGLVVSRVKARRRRATFLETLATATATVAFALMLIAGASWLLADIPPRIDGEKLFLLAEVRWPAAALPPGSLPAIPHLRLGALRGSVVRRLEPGAMFVEDARHEEGRWIVPGAVPIFTTRGGRLLELGTEEQSIAAFRVPLPRYPRGAERQWSGWLPAARPGEPAPPDQFTYRFKVIRESEPVRTQAVGAFDIDTVADYFYYVSPESRLAAHARFRVRFKGQAIERASPAERVAVVKAGRPALMVVADDPDDGTPCVLLVDEGKTLRVQPVEGCVTPLVVRPLTSDQARVDAARAQEHVPGWIDRGSFDQPGLYLLGTAIVDTRGFTVRSFVLPANARPDPGVPPLDLSPDERSFAWFVQDADESPRLAVTDWHSGETVILPIDRTRMRYNHAAALGPRWVQHHFRWTRGAGGIDVLVERADFVPLPYRGELTLGKPGEYQSYTLQSGEEALRSAILAALLELGGERLPSEAVGPQHRVRVRGEVVNVTIIGSPAYLSVSIEAGSDPAVMADIAAALDAMLATGRYDGLFRAP